MKNDIEILGKLVFIEDVKKTDGEIFFHKGDIGFYSEYEDYILIMDKDSLTSVHRFPKKCMDDIFIDITESFTEVVKEWFGGR